MTTEHMPAGFLILTMTFQTKKLSDIMVPVRRSCPHTWLPINQEINDESNICNICKEIYFSMEGGYEPPIQLPCSHVFGKNCFEKLREDNLSCPFRCVNLPLNLRDCSKCSEFETTRLKDNPLVIMIRPKEILGELKTALKELAEEDVLFKLSIKDMRALSRFWRSILAKSAYQYHDTTDLAETLDPFVVEAERSWAKKRYGKQCYKPVSKKRLNPEKFFPSRIDNIEDYPAKKEPWISAFLRQWASDYVMANGTVEQAFSWGVRPRHAAEPKDGIWPMYWRVKRIIQHRNIDGRVEYRVQWVGKRWAPEWIGSQSLEEMTNLVQKYKRQNSAGRQGDRENGTLKNK
jgi:hypothetical protein